VYVKHEKDRFDIVSSKISSAKSFHDIELIFLLFQKHEATLNDIACT